MHLPLSSSLCPRLPFSVRSLFSLHPLLVAGSVIRLSCLGYPYSYGFSRDGSCVPSFTTSFSPSPFFPRRIRGSPPFAAQSIVVHTKYCAQSCDRRTKAKMPERAFGFLEARAIAQPWNTQSRCRWRTAGTQRYGMSPPCLSFPRASNALLCSLPSSRSLQFAPLRQPS